LGINGLKSITKKILISGATGLLGSRLHKRFLDRNFIVHTIGRSQKDTYFYDFAKKNQELPIVNSRYDLFVHCAWYTVHPHFWHSEYNLTFYNNSANLSEGISSHVDKIVTLGTCAEYDEINAKELDNYKLGASKLSLRKALFNMCAIEKILWLPVYFAYGEGEPESKILSQIRMGKLKKETIKNLDAVRDFVHFDDAVRMVSKLIDSNASGIHDIGTGRGVKIGDLFEDSKTELYQDSPCDTQLGDVKIAQSATLLWEDSDYPIFEAKLRKYIHTKLLGALR
jgi:nucleoside-diphosphate-sugar epimerase